MGTRTTEGVTKTDGDDWELSLSIEHLYVTIEVPRGHKLNVMLAYVNVYLFLGGQLPIRE